MAANEEKEAPALPKAGAKARALKAKKQCRKASTAKHKKGAPRPPSDGPAHCGSEGSPGILGRAPPGEASLTMTAMPPSSPPAPTAQSALTKIEDNSVIVFIVEVTAHAHQIRQL